MMGEHNVASNLVSILHIAAALAAGGAIGLERTFHGRAAGFRTYALLCMGSAMAMIVTTFPNQLADGVMNTPGDASRIVQGVLTGIGFLGAGVIVKYGFTVRGLTTAASIWTTAIIGILIGARYYWESLAAVILVLLTLSALRWLEDRMDKECYAQVKVGFVTTSAISKREVDKLIEAAGLRIAQESYGFEKNRDLIEFEYVVSSFKVDGLAVLAELFRNHPGLANFNISPSQD